ncbi:anaphase-promoting complex subunit 5-like isoform X2 [Rhizophagus clarus]|uniref:Anaphase-promoting complex subunit 5 n=1 Tax=Rhizophagus clarus TaxID=94130 RepID=A0A8H3LEY4_9GLOM|nr:anaphase-promoting complex subunit 5-like isoform X2 [Rhizophagus clarus]
MLTPHKISLLILIEAYWEIIETDSTTPEKLEPLLFFLIEKISDEKRFPEPTLTELCKELSKISDNTDNITNNFNEILLAKLVVIVTPHELTLSIKEMKRFFTRDAELYLFIRNICSTETLVKRTAKPSNLYTKDTYVPLEISEMTELAQRFHMHKQELIPKNDAESFSHYVITQLRKYGGILPLEIEEKLRKIHDRIPEISSIYYIEFVKYMQTGEYEGALTNFYKYSNFCPDDPENRSWYQYVLLNLVVLHAKFGHKEQAILAIREAIEMARENNDQECLRFALSWLYRLKSSDQTTGTRVSASEQQMLESLISKAKQANFMYLQALGELGKSQRQIQQGSSPTEVFESLLRSSVLNMNCPFKTMRFQGHLLNASVWQTYGSDTLANLFTHEVINNPDPSPEDRVTAICQLADNHISHGNYMNAFEVLAKSKVHFNGIRRAVSQWVFCFEKLMYQKSFNRDEIFNIGAIEHQIRACCQDDDLFRADFEFNRALYLAKTDQPDEGVDVLHKLINQSCRIGNQNQMLVANYLLKIAEIRIETEDLTSALPYVLSSLCLTGRAKSMIEKIMPVILAEHSLHLQSVAQYIYAQCLIACIDQDLQANRKQSINWQDVLYALDASRIGFKHLESISELLNVFQLMSYIYNIKGDINMRNRCAKEFRILMMLQEKNRRKQPDWNMTYYSRCIKLNQQEQENEAKQSIMSMEIENNYMEESSTFKINI